MDGVAIVIEVVDPQDIGLSVSGAIGVETGHGLLGELFPDLELAEGRGGVGRAGTQHQLGPRVELVGGPEETEPGTESCAIRAKRV